MRQCITAILAVLFAASLWAQSPQTATDRPEKHSNQDAIVERLQQMLIAQQAEIEKLRQAVDELKTAEPQAPHAPSLGTVASTAPIIPTGDVIAEPKLKPVVERSGSAQKELAAEGAPESPLQFHIGSAYITPVGFMDFTSEFRSKDNGSGIGTNFGSIPYGTSIFQANMSEFRFSMQNSRIGFRVDANVKGAHVIGYMESDFLGNNPGNVAVSSNSNTLRSRLYWADIRKGGWEMLAGQTWSLITPGRTGISPLPGNLFYTQNIDVNYQAGLFWGRIPELRVVYHTPGDKAAFAVAVDSPEQYIGGSAGGGSPTFPAALSGTYPGGELNNGATTLAVPNRAPDLIAKLALDPTKRFHFEFGGVARFFQTFNPATGADFSTTGGGGFVNLNFELFKGLRLLTANFWSDGGGRYIFGEAPDLIARVDGSPSLIHSGSTVSGLEFAHKNTLVYAYYGGIYIGRNFVLDTNGKPVGYGFAGSPSSQNRTIQEGTFGINQTFWKNDRYGALTLMTQYSYLQRNPWDGAAGQPSNANLHMLFLNLRYSLPGAAPAMK